MGQRTTSSSARKSGWARPCSSSEVPPRSKENQAPYTAPRGRLRSDLIRIDLVLLRARPWGCATFVHQAPCDGSREKSASNPSAAFVCSPSAGLTADDQSSNGAVWVTHARDGYFVLWKGLRAKDVTKAA